MSETIPGGAYLSSDGKTWHDANGNPLSKKQVAEAEALQAEQAEKREAEERANQERLAAAQGIVFVAQPAAPAVAPAPKSPSKSSVEKTEKQSADKTEKQS
jgi:hypothetical protein